VGVVDLESEIFSSLLELPEGKGMAVRSCQMLLSVPRSLSWWYPFEGGAAASSTALSTERNLVSARRIDGGEAARV